MLYVALGFAFLFLLGARFFSRPVGGLAVILALFAPHAFYHNHLACFDGPIVGLTVASTYAYLRALESRMVAPNWAVRQRS